MFFTPQNLLLGLLSGVLSSSIVFANSYANNNANSYANNQANPNLYIQSAPNQSFVWSDKDEDLSRQQKFLLAKRYENSPGKQQLALKYLNDSAGMGYAQAQYHLGMKYYRGEGLRKNLSQAQKWLLKAAQQNFSKAMFQLARMEQNGETGEISHQQSQKWLKQASENGSGEAQHALAIQYLKNTDMLDPQQAVFWLEKAVQQDNSDAKRDLGFLYMQGLGVDKDFLKALELLKTPAQEGNPLSQYLLGELYAEGGYGIEKHPKKSLHWYQLALQSGYMDAKIGIRKLNGTNRKGKNRSFVATKLSSNKVASNKVSSNKVASNKVSSKSIAKSGQKTKVDFDSNLVYDWKRAWQNKDFERYRNFYSKQFKNRKNDYWSWIGYRRKMIAKAHNIRIDISRLTIHRVKKNRVMVKFHQQYQSETYSDKVLKQQYWLKDNDSKWRIVYEGSQKL